MTVRKATLVETVPEAKAAIFLRLRKEVAERRAQGRGDDVGQPERQD